MGKGDVLKKQIQYYSYCLGSLIFLIFGKTIGNNGIVYLAIAMETMAIFMVFLGDGIADVYSKMLRIRRKRGQYYDALAVKKRVKTIQALLGIVFTILVFLLADIIAIRIFQTDKAALIIRILAPVLLLRMIQSILCGYFQSFGVHLSLAFVYVLRQILFWILGKFICENRLSYGEKVAALLKSDDYKGLYGAIGLAIAIVITEIILVIALFIYYFLNDRNYDKKKSDRNMHKTEGLGVTLRNYAYLSSTQCYLGIIKRLFVLFPFILLINNMEHAGVLYGKFLPLFSIPIFLMCARYSVLYSRLTSVIRNKDGRMNREHIQTGIQYTWTVSLLFVALLAILAPQITEAFFPQDLLMKNLLQYGSILIIPVSMMIFLCMVHIAYNRKIECIITMLITTILYVVISNTMYHKLQKPETVIYAACISLFIGAVIFMVISTFLFGLRLEYIMVFVLPLICIGVAGVIVLLMTKFMTPHIGNTISCVVGAVLCIVLYVAGLSICRVFSELEIERLYGPIGRKLFSFIFK